MTTSALQLWLKPNEFVYCKIKHYKLLIRYPIVVSNSPLDLNGQTAWREIFSLRMRCPKVGHYSRVVAQMPATPLGWTLRLTAVSIAYELPFLIIIYV